MIPGTLYRYMYLVPDEYLSCMDDLFDSCSNSLGCLVSHFSVRRECAALHARPECPAQIHQLIKTDSHLDHRVDRASSSKAKMEKSSVSGAYAQMFRIASEDTTFNEWEQALSSLLQYPRATNVDGWWIG